jgi:hypothetical protein
LGFQNHLIEPENVGGILYVIISRSWYNYRHAEGGLKEDEILIYV